ncbi:MAG TPA: hypothetical protein VHF69_14435, partial [Candidatus Synoicihabitans sp.]|nr:hypothetical protein [Candidatus Synoicihabitans sp.]
SEVVVARQPSARGYFFKSVPEFVLPGFAEVRRCIYHINLSEIGAEEFESKKAMLQDARGIIFDWRFSGERKARTENRRR